MVRFLNNLSWAFHVNSSTLSGALDVIVIQHEDGTLHSSPFHVRFGKFKILKSRAKTVRIAVNGVMTDVQMKLTDSGKGYFEEKATEETSMSNLLEEETKSNSSSRRNSGKKWWVKESFHSSDQESDSKKDTKPKSEKDKQSDIEKRIEFSLCADAIGTIPNPSQIFKRNSISFDSFEKNLNDMLSNQQLMLRIDGEYHTRETGIPLMYSIISSYETDEVLEPIASPVDNSSPKFVNTLALDSNRLSQLGLVYGENAVQYIVMSRLQGRRTLHGKIYLWHHTSKIVISDIDGTITKSDFLGHVLPSIGIDWSRLGVVNIYKQIEDNGYKILYLSSRPIGQMKSTRELLASIIQDGQLLPEGPLFVSPDSVFTSFVREMIKHIPHIFKANTLQQVSDLFPTGTQPFCAGFGNKITDSIAYRQCMIPVENIFIFSENGAVNSHEGIPINSFAELNKNIRIKLPPITQFC